MGTRLFNSVLKDDLHPTRKSIMLTLAMRADGTGLFRVTLPQIMADTGHGHSTIRTALATLKEQGRIPDLLITRGPKANVTGTIVVLAASGITSQNEPEEESDSGVVLGASGTMADSPRVRASTPPRPTHSSLCWQTLLREIPTYAVTPEQEDRTQERFDEAGFSEEEIRMNALALVSYKDRDKYKRHDMTLFKWIERDRKQNGPAVPTDVVDWEAEKAKYG